jgi:hypothetical protein
MAEDFNKNNVYDQELPGLTPRSTSPEVAGQVGTRAEALSLWASHVWLANAGD